MSLKTPDSTTLSDRWKVILHSPSLKPVQKYSKTSLKQMKLVMFCHNVQHLRVEGLCATIVSFATENSRWVRIYVSVGSEHVPLAYPLQREDHMMHTDSTVACLKEQKGKVKCTLSMVNPSTDCMSDSLRTHAENRATKSQKDQLKMQIT